MSEAEKKAIVSEYTRSRESLKTFAESKNIAYSTLARWSKKYGCEKRRVQVKKAKTPVKWLTMTTDEAENVAIKPQKIEIVCGKFVIIIERDTDIKFLSTTLKAILSCC